MTDGVRIEIIVLGTVLGVIAFLIRNMFGGDRD